MSRGDPARRDGPPGEDKLAGNPLRRLASWGSTDEHGLYVDGGQGEAVRVPQADATLVKVPGVVEPDAELTASLLSLSDVPATGHHAALGARVVPARTVVGDGAVGLGGVRRHVRAAGCRYAAEVPRVGCCRETVGP